MASGDSEESLRAQKLELVKKLDALHAKVYELDMEESGLTEVELDLDGGADGANAADGDEDGGEPKPLDGFKLGPAESARLEHLAHSLATRRQELHSAKDWSALQTNERRYARCLAYLLANQQTQLDHQREYVIKLRENLQMIKEEDRNAVQAAISDALQTPMQAAANSIIELISSLSNNDTVAIPLSKVLKQISAANLYQPTFDFDSEVDTDTQKWISSTFATAKTGRSRLDQRRNAMVSFGHLQQASPRELQRTNLVMQTLQSYSFNQFDYEEQELGQLMHDFFGKFNILEEYKIPVPIFRSFMAEIRKSYHDNQYHNFRHAFDVCQMLYSFLTLTNATQYLTAMDIFTMMVAAVCHDVDHNGLNNNFHINSQSPLALLYNDQSILENHHCSFACKILARTENNLFANLGTKESKNARSKLIQCILATDMSNHFDVIDKFKLKVDTVHLKKEKDDDRQN